MEVEKDQADQDRQSSPQENPHDRELDVEGPNESAPGHEPRSADERQTDAQGEEERS